METGFTSSRVRTKKGCWVRKMSEEWRRRQSNTETPSTISMNFDPFWFQGRQVEVAEVLSTLNKLSEGDL